MAARYYIENGDTVSEVMPLDWEGGLATVLFFDALGAPATVSGMPLIYQSVYESGDIWKKVSPFTIGEWRFNGPSARVRVDMSGVTGFTSYRVIIWRADDSVSMIPSGAFSGNRAITVQPYTEANVKAGLQFYLRAVWGLTDVIAAGTTRKISVITGAKPVLIKLREFSYIAEEITLRLFSGASGVTGGTALTINNYNAVAPVAATVSARKNVTTVSDGVLFDGGDSDIFLGAASAPQRGAASLPDGRERVLPPNTSYIVAITNSGGGNARCRYFLDWYEGGTDLPIKPQ